MTHKNFVLLHYGLLFYIHLVLFTGVEVELGAYSFNTMVRDNPLIELSEDFELKGAFVENLQFIIPWQNKAFSGDQLDEITKESAMVTFNHLEQAKIPLNLNNFYYLNHYIYIVGCWSP